MAPKIPFSSAAATLAVLVTMGGCAPGDEQELAVTVRPLRGAFAAEDPIPGCSDETDECVILGRLRHPETEGDALKGNTAEELEAQEYFAAFDWSRAWGRDRPAISGWSPQSLLGHRAHNVTADKPWHLTLLMGNLNGVQIPAPTPMHEDRTITVTRPLALAHVGPFTLPAGYRARFELALYPIFHPDQAEASARNGLLDIARCEDPDRPDLAEPPDVFASAVTTLPDGRVLVAGGFRVDRPASCPAWASAGGAATAACVEVTATSEVWIFAPEQGCFYRPRGGVLQRPRGGARAVALPSGRVVVVGGAERALLVQQRDGDREGVVATWLLPRDPAQGTLGSFELFLPNQGVLADDPLRDGDPARGGFALVGTLAQPRFLAASTAVPAGRNGIEMVFVAGGTQSPWTYEVLDLDRPGGPGPSPAAVEEDASLRDPMGNPIRGVGALQLARFLPAAFALPNDGQILVAGGAFPTNSAQAERVAEAWVVQIREGSPMDGGVPTGGEDSTTTTKLARITPTPPDSLRSAGASFSFLAPAVASGLAPTATTAGQPATGRNAMGFVFGGFGPPCTSGEDGPTVATGGWSGSAFSSASQDDLESFLADVAAELFGPAGFCPPEVAAGGFAATVEQATATPQLAPVTVQARHPQGVAVLLDSGRVALLGGATAARPDSAPADELGRIALFDPLLSSTGVPGLYVQPPEKLPVMGGTRAGATFLSATWIPMGGLLVLPGVRQVGGTFEVAGGAGVLHIEPRCFALEGRGDEYCR